MHDLTEFQRDLLFVIAGLDEPSGLEIKDKLEEYYQENVRHGRLYPNLDTLVNARFVKKGQQDKRTNKYVLMDRGKREIVTHLKWQLENCPGDVLDELEGFIEESRAPQRADSEASVS